MGFIKDTEVKLPQPTTLENKTPAPVQITAEQILREACGQEEADIQPPKLRITDPTELANHRLQKRKEFEDLILGVRCNVSVWIKYAQWEESQKDFKRACSIWERAVTLLPADDQLWDKYIHMEVFIGNVTGARQIYERWMNQMPSQQGWLSFIVFELSRNEVERTRVIFERFVKCHPRVDTWIQFAKFEMKNGEVARARNVCERAVKILADDEEAERLFVAFTEFKKWCKETDQARCIYESVLDLIPKGMAEDLYKKFVGFENRYGDRQGIEFANVGKRRFQYEDEFSKNPRNYNSWFAYIRLEERAGNKDRIREVYQRAISNVPLAPEKQYWRCYIYLWINYALYEELDAGDMECTRNVYRDCLNQIPHKEFSFAKIWLLAAQFEIRQLNLKGARQILGDAIDRAPKDKIFKNYIEIEQKLGNMDRCRKLYAKYLEWSPKNCCAWAKYAELEQSLCETERTRSLFELAIAQVDMPESLWKAYIDFELSEGEFERTRALYERLLDQTKHLKVWIRYAKFEASAIVGDGVDSDMAEDQAQDYLREQKKQCLVCARKVFEKALDYFRTSAAELKECMLLEEEWSNMEASFGYLGDVSLVPSKLPMKLNKRMPIVTEAGHGYAEYIDSMFSQEAQTTNPKLLEAACKWKKQLVKQHGTTILLVVLPHHVLIAADSRLSSYTNEIQRGPQPLKISELSSSPPASGCFCGDVYEGTQLLDHLKRVTRMSIMDGANQYLYRPKHQSYGAFIALKLTEYEKPRGYRLFNTIKVKKHRDGCRHEVDWSSCNCPRIQDDSGCRRMERGIHFMGSGSRNATSYCEVKYRSKRLRLEGSGGTCFSLLGELNIGLSEATQDAFKILLTASLFDPSSGGPFRVHSISEDKSELMQERQTFLEASRRHYDCIEPIMVDSIFLVYPTCLEKMDILTNLGIRSDEIEFSGHPLTWLQGGYTLQFVSFNRPDNVFNTLERAIEVQERLEFTDNSDGIRFFNLIHEGEGHRKATSRVYVGNLTPEFLNGLIESPPEELSDL